ncbi:extracellular solute-binding protein [Microbacterium sp. GXF7504]
MPQHPVTRQLRWTLLAAPLAGALVLAGCAGGGDSSSDSDAAEEGFSIMVAVANDGDDAYQQLVDAFTEETGVPVEYITYPSEAYNQQVRTQLQAGTAADIMILAPGTGQEISVVPLAEEGFLEPVESASKVIPAGTESQYEVDGKLYAQPNGLMPVGFVYNGAAAEEAGIDEFPATFEDLIKECTTARDAGKSFTALAGAAAPNTGMLGMNLAASRVYGEDPEWNTKRAEGKVTFADSAWVDALEAVVEMNDAGCFQDGAAGSGFDAITNGVVGGTSLTGIVPGSAALSMNAAKEGAGIVVEAIPAPKGATETLYASANYAFALNAKASDGAKASAKKFLEWMTEPEQAILFADLYGMVPIIGVTDDNLLAEFQPISQLVMDGNYTGIPNADWPSAAVYDALATGVQGLLTGQKTPVQVAEDMDQAWG